MQLSTLLLCFGFVFLPLRAYASQREHKPSISLPAFKGHPSVRSNHPQVLHDCLHGCSKVNEQDKNGQTALLRACLQGEEDAVRALLECKSVDVDLADKEGMTPLMAAAIGDPDYGFSIFKMIVAVADFHKKDNKSRTAYRYTKLSGNTTFAAYLKQENKKRLKEKKKKRSVVYPKKPSKSNGKEKGRETPFVTVDQDYSVQRAKEIEPGLELVAVNGDRETGERTYFKSKDPDKAFFMYSDLFYIHFLALIGDYYLINEELSKNPSIINSQDEDGRTALFVACTRKKNKLVLKSLLKYLDLDVDLADTMGRTPLMMLARHGRVEDVKLLSSRANLSKRDRSNKRAPAYALEAGNYKVAEFLRIKMEKPSNTCLPSMEC